MGAQRDRAGAAAVRRLAVVAHPKEVAYFNKPVTSSTEIAIPPKVGSYAMSAPAWDPARQSVWYSDANSGFYAVRLTNGVGNLLK